MSKIDEVLQGTIENHIAPFLWVHGEDHEAYRETILAMHKAGIGALCIEARPHPDFNGEGWFSDIAFIIDLCRSLGMKVWLLDDSHFPTGFANGEVAKNHSERRKRYLRLQTFDVMGPLKCSQLNLSYALMDPETKILAVLAQRRTEDDEPDVSDTRDLTSLVHERKDWRFSRPSTDPLGRPTGASEGPVTVVDLDLPEGAWYIQVLMVSYHGGEKETEGYLNPLEKEATQILLDTVYEPIFEHFGDECGHTFQGFFSDEPRFGNIHGSEGASIGRNPQMVLPWTEEVLVRLAERLTEEFLESEEEIVRYLPLLFFGESAEAHAMRYAYMDAVSELWSENFDGMIADWCHRHNVRHIGHTIEDNNAVARLGYGAGHYFRALAHADMAGIDVVMQQLMPGYDKGLFRAFHKPGWDAEFFTYVLGKIGSSLAHIDPAKHGACMAEVFGAYGWEEGLPLMKYLADYMLVRGVNYFVPHAFSPKAFPDGDCPPHLYAHGMNPQYPELKVLMDYMNRLAALLSGGTYAAPVALYFNAEGEWSGDWQLAQKPARVLARSLIEYDFISADWLMEAKAEEGEDGVWRLVAGAERFRALVLPWSEALPEALLLKVAELSQNIPVWFLCGLPERTSEGHEVPDLSCVHIASLDDLADKLYGAGIGELLPSEPEPWLRSYHYVLDGVDEYFFVNESPSERVQCTLMGAPEGNGYVFDAFSGRLFADPEPFALDLAPGASKFVLVSKTPLEAEEALPAFEASSHRVLTSCTAELSSFESRGTEWSAPYRLSKPAFATNLPGQESFAGYVRYRFSFELTEAEAAAPIMLELADVAGVVRVQANGRELGVCIVPDWSFSLDGAVHPGRNEILVEVAGTLGRAMDDFVGQFLPITPTGIDGAELVFGA